MEKFNPQNWQEIPKNQSIEPNHSEIKEFNADAGQITEMLRNNFFNNLNIKEKYNIQPEIYELLRDKERLDQEMEIVERQIEEIKQYPDQNTEKDLSLLERELLSLTEQSSDALRKLGYTVQSNPALGKAYKEYVANKRIREKLTNPFNVDQN